MRYGTLNGFVFRSHQWIWLLYLVMGMIADALSPILSRCLHLHRRPASDFLVRFIFVALQVSSPQRSFSFSRRMWMPLVMKNSFVSEERQQGSPANILVIYADLRQKQSAKRPWTIQTSFLTFRKPMPLNLSSRRRLFRCPVCVVSFKTETFISQLWITSRVACLLRYGRHILYIVKSSSRSSCAIMFSNCVD